MENLDRDEARLPPELTDHIIDYLHDDKPSLASCSLVCRSWLPKSSAHLFYLVKHRYPSEKPGEIAPEPPRPQKMVNFQNLHGFFLQCPRAAAHVRELQLKSRPRWDYAPHPILQTDTLVEIIGALPKLQLLILNMSEIEHPRDVIPTIELKNLIIHVNDHRLHVLELVSLFKSIDSLIIGHNNDDFARCHGSSCNTGSRRVPVRSLSMLTHESVEGSLFLGKLRGLLDPDKLQDLHLMSWGEWIIEDFNSFLLEFGRELRSFRCRDSLITIINPGTLSFSPCVQLERIEIPTYISINSLNEDQHEWVSSVQTLYTIPPSIRQIHITVFLSGLPLEEQSLGSEADRVAVLNVLRSQDWTILDDITQRLPKLEMLELEAIRTGGGLEVADLPYVDEIEKIVAARLSASMRNILRVL